MHLLLLFYARGRNVLECALHWESSAKNKFNFTSAVIRSNRSSCLITSSASGAGIFFCGKKQNSPNHRVQGQCDQELAINSAACNKSQIVALAGYCDQKKATAIKIIICQAT